MPVLHHLTVYPYTVDPTRTRVTTNMTTRFRYSIAMALHAIIATSFNTGILVVVGVDSFQVGVSSPPTTAMIAVGRRRYEPSIASSSSSLRSCNINHIHQHHNHNLRLQFPVTSSPTYLSASTSSSPNTTNNEDDDEIDSLIVRTSNALRASSWFSWWSQVILTVISSITFIFARNVMTMPTTTAAAIGQGGPITIGKFFLPGLGIVASSLSIIWTWGQRRLARRFVRPRRRDGDGGGRKSPSITGITTTTTTSRIEAANLLRSTIKFGVSLNLFGLLTSVLGAQYIVGTLVAKSMQSFVGLGGVGITSQTLQPLDVLVVQANTNVLNSHFVSLVCLLWLTRMVDLLDPPSLEEDV